MTIPTSFPSIKPLTEADIKTIRGMIARVNYTVGRLESGAPALRAALMESPIPLMDRWVNYATQMLKVHEDKKGETP